MRKPPQPELSIATLKLVKKKEEINNGEIVYEMKKILFMSWSGDVFCFKSSDSFEYSDTIDGNFRYLYIKDPISNEYLNVDTTKQFNLSS